MSNTLKPYNLILCKDDAFFLSLFYRFPAGTPLPGPGQKVVPPEGTLPRPIKAIGNLNTYFSPLFYFYSSFLRIVNTCEVAVEFPYAGVALRNMQGLPCYGRPLIFKRYLFH